VQQTKVAMVVIMRESQVLTIMSTRFMMTSNIRTLDRRRKVMAMIMCKDTIMFSFLMVVCNVLITM
jgi:hypothetical protein